MCHGKIQLVHPDTWGQLLILHKEKSRWYIWLRQRAWCSEIALINASSCIHLNASIIINFHNSITCFDAHVTMQIFVSVRALTSSPLRAMAQARTWCSRTQHKNWWNCPQAQTHFCMWVLNTWASSAPCRKVRLDTHRQTHWPIDTHTHTHTFIIL